MQVRFYPFIEKISVVKLPYMWMARFLVLFFLKLLLFLCFYDKIFLRIKYAVRLQKEVGVIKGEFYYANEYNSTTEYKKFPAEMYIVSKEYGDTGKENADCGAEITHSSKKIPPKKTENGNLADQILNSLKGVAATSSVAAAAVLGATTMAPPPKIELLEFAVGGNYIEYEIDVEKIQDDLQYFIIVSTTNEEDKEFLVEQDGVYKNKVEDLKSEWEYSLTFVSYDETWGKSVYFEKTFQTTAFIEEPPELPPDDRPELPPEYQAGVSNVTVSGLNEIRVDFWTGNLEDSCVLELLVSYGTDDVFTIAPTARELAQGYVKASVLENAEVISIQPIIKYGADGESMAFTPYEQSLDATLTADVKVNSTYGSVVFYLKGITGGGTYVHIVNAATLEELLSEELYDNYVTYYYESETPMEYTIFLTDSEGKKTTSEFNTVVDPTAQEMGEYVFNYKNPGDVGVTYNDDGTINVYIQTDFSTLDDRLYYQVTLGDMRFKSRDAIFVAEGLPNKSYALIYDICYDENGIQYSIEEISVSGMVNEMYAENFVSTVLFENVVTLTVNAYDVNTVDLNSIRAVSSTGEEITVSENDFLYDEEYGEYVCSVQLLNDFEWVTVYVSCNPFGDNMDGIDNYVGSLFFEITITLEKNI